MFGSTFFSLFLCFIEKNTFDDGFVSACQVTTQNTHRALCCVFVRWTTSSLNVGLRARAYCLKMKFMMNTERENKKLYINIVKKNKKL